MTEILFKELSYAIVGAAMEAHRILGPGFLKAVYEAALAHELTLHGIRFETQKRLPVYYKGQMVGDYVADFVVEDQIISTGLPSAALRAGRTGPQARYKILRESLTEAAAAPFRRLRRIANSEAGNPQFTVRKPKF
jgi:hypothetical protein